MEKQPSDNDSEEARSENYKKFEHFVELMCGANGFKIEDLQEPEKRIELIKSMSADQFIELLWASNSILRTGKIERWDGENHRAVVVSGVSAESPELDPPEENYELFRELYDVIKEEISIDNIDIIATKLYAAIVLLHMFPDGNGRLARNSYKLLSNGLLFENDKGSNRPSEIDGFCSQLSMRSNKVTMYNSGIKRDTFAEYQDLSAEENKKFEDVVEASDGSQMLKYAAAYELGLCDGFEDEFGFVSGGEWSDEQRKQFYIKYEEIKKKKFWNAMRILDNIAWSGRLKEILSD